MNDEFIFYQIENQNMSNIAPHSLTCLLVTAPAL